MVTLPILSEIWNLNELYYSAVRNSQATKEKDARNGDLLRSRYHKLPDPWDGQHEERDVSHDIRDCAPKEVAQRIDTGTWGLVVPEGVDRCAVEYCCKDLWVPNVSISHVADSMVILTVAAHQAATTSPKSRSGLKVCGIEKMRR